MKRRETSVKRLLLLALVAIMFLGAGGCLLQRAFYGVAPGVTVGGYQVGGYLDGEVIQLLTHLAIETNKPPQNAHFTKKGEIIPETRGVEVDIARTAERVMSADKNARVSLVLNHPEPEITAALLKSLTKVLGKYTTHVGGSHNRYQNVVKAAETLNYTLVKPYSMMSFNQTVGPRTAARGYFPAPVIMGGGMALDAGGGVCQVSSTLYNAVLAAKLKVVERHPHSKRVHYVPPGRDATVSFPGPDFKFYNQHSTPIIIRAQSNGRALSIWLLGSGSEGEESGTKQ